MRPGKLRLEVERQTSPAPTTPMCPPRQAPQVATVQPAPASMKVPISPSRSASRATCAEEGVMIRRTQGATWRPLRTAAARRRSPILLLVQEPMKTWSRRVPATSSMEAVWSGDIGLARVIGMVAASNSKVFSYSASGSEATGV